MATYQREQRIVRGGNLESRGVFTRGVRAADRGEQGVEEVPAKGTRKEYDFTKESNDTATPGWTEIAS